MPLSIVVLDTCVLLQTTPRDTLLRSAREGLYRLYWTEDILEEVQRNLISKWRMSPEKAQKLTDAMRKCFPGAMITHHKRLIEAMPNEAKDRHVLAAAVACKADIIVTENIRHFREDQLDPFGVKAKSLDAFLTYLYSYSPEIVENIIRAQTEALHNPPMTIEDIEDRLAKTAPNFVAQLRKNTPHLEPAPVSLRIQKRI